MTRELTVVRYRETRPTVYCFSFKDGSWAHFSVNDETGDFSIQSDWGNYGHRWSVDPKYLGEPNLSCFLARAGAHYIVEKLGYDEPRTFSREFDEEATRGAILKYICELRRRESIDKELARDAYNSIERMDCSPEELYYNLPRWAYEVLKDVNVTEFFIYKPSLQYLLLVEQLIPLFQKKLKDVGYGRQERHQSPPSDEGSLG